jgi:polyhydroxyalkanoate synthase
MFAWMRANDLIWNYSVNNYLLGNQPPAFDILYWNADTTRLPARLHGDYLDLYFTNPFVNADRIRRLQQHRLLLRRDRRPPDRRMLQA